ncbi:hypothetical protein D0B54_00590 [Solimonas sp. K1W22B-7]|uniref:hypothetical protein n=1 Tax=Solimonas sp. K1W22B-7 TaxID=2303331 RepID=UPI000E33230D|nr:hypothetical protein [Solimonas sp. K1W22B-7]AXQ27276.1 hypothetical protein D0B54_00590 [Solimonas sp. K1W22B-7]
MEANDEQKQKNTVLVILTVLGVALMLTWAVASSIREFLLACQSFVKSLSMATRDTDMSFGFGLHYNYKLEELLRRTAQTAGSGRPASFGLPKSVT